MQDWSHRLPVGIDVAKPNAARCYDYYLGGAHNFAVDRQFARRIVSAMPSIRQVAQSNRAFLRRAVLFCLERGVRQFLDIGAGIPTVGNIHDIAAREVSEARVVYVDNEPTAVAHGRTMLGGQDRATIIGGDLLDVDGVLNAPETRRMLDLSQPVGIMMVALLHFVPDVQAPREVLKHYHDAVAPGSFLGLSHFTGDDRPEEVDAVVELYDRSITPVTVRTRAEVAELVSSFETVDPGVVYLPEWHPESPEDVAEDPASSCLYGVLGRKV